MDHDELHTLAKRYRALAKHVTDEPTKRGLLDLAEKYEARARGDKDLDEGLPDRDA